MDEFVGFLRCSDQFPWRHYQWEDDNILGDFIEDEVIWKSVDATQLVVLREQLDEIWLRWRAGFFNACALAWTMEKMRTLDVSKVFNVTHWADS